MENWQKEWGENITKVDQLSEILTIADKEKLSDIVERHPMSIPKYYLDLIDKDNPNDPIRKLSVPGIMELDMSGDYDTSGESQNTKFAGVQHKYATTMLVLTTNACFMYCRHCFRKRMVGYSQDEIMNRLDMTIDYLKQHEEVNNVLLSGGDSFCLKTDTIEEYLMRMKEIEHLDFIRFGTRAPVVFPQRIYEDKRLLGILKDVAKVKKISVVTQFNHPVELTEEAQRGINALIEAGVTVNNQTVLLKGINDDPEVLAELLNTLVRFGVNPYYVFQCRPVKFVKSSFQLPLIESYRIIEEARKKLNGFSKRFKFIMSHVRGKIEILGECDDELIFKFHQAKSDDDFGLMFKRRVEPNGRWLDADLNFID